MRDVARIAGVSVGTASRVINDAANVEKSNKDRVLKAIEELGYVPNRAAQGVRGKRTREVGIIIRDITIPVLAGFVKAAQTVFEEAGAVLLISSAGTRRERELELLEQFRKRTVDGLVMTTYDENDAELAAARHRLKLPVVFFDRDIDGPEDCVVVDHFEGTRQATSYLLGLGHRRILHITGRMTTHPARARHEGYVRAFADAGVPVDPNYIHCSGFDATTAFRETSARIGQSDRPTAIIAGGIDMLPGVLKAVRARRLRIPEDISIVANGDSDLAVLATPSVSVIRWDYEEMGRTCAHMILEHLDGEPSRKQRKIGFSTEFVVRDSCAPPPDLS
ncbi:LacI family transcriptional regulator [Diaphorobacter sp. HDW4A]|nr:LacI family transcriptional regulator [Diaphorobacter sp. HDW4A]